VVAGPRRSDGVITKPYTLKSEEKLVAVVIPIYQSVLSDTEQMALRQCASVLGRYPVKIVKPAGLILDLAAFDFTDCEFIDFDDRYFKDIDGYNALMISSHFYERFLAYKYLLIYQLDAYVFRDELTDWCNKDFDYVGAPTLHRSNYDAMPADASESYKNALSTHRFVLNGGLSLRKIRSFIRYLKIYNIFYPAWKGNEDMLFSQEATRLFPMKMFMKQPSWQEAIRFSFEKSPAATFELNDRKLPFACHAWERYDPEFWKPYIGFSHQPE
jgi:hypothetical protein